VICGSFYFLALISVIIKKKENDCRKNVKKSFRKGKIWGKKVIAEIQD